MTARAQQRIGTLRPRRPVTYRRYLDCRPAYVRRRAGPSMTVLVRRLSPCMTNKIPRREKAKDHCVVQSRDCHNVFMTHREASTSKPSTLAQYGSKAATAVVLKVAEEREFNIHRTHGLHSAASLFRASRCAWAAQRKTVKTLVGDGLSLTIISERMIGNNEPWEALRTFCGTILSRKEAAERKCKETSSLVEIRRQQTGCRRNAHGFLYLNLCRGRSILRSPPSICGREMT
ncbi:hypothetical protein EVAR_17336_1 [Eumeta japonica]|uniref:Uncharacterized protein n=1 Tax=Eumeta variegata TaxID=151549 RepID=A0A4C1TT81_EUMVA|nr:hypothetical protein EVAR_17336_1 [Eumeta japonica]